MANARPTKKLIPRVKDLQAQMDELNAQITTLKRTDARSAIGLGDAKDKKKYDVLLGVVRKFTAQYFNVEQCLGANPEIRVCRVIALIQEDQPFFKDFENGWPVRAIMQTYLSNSAFKAKMRREALQEDKENVLLSFDEDIYLDNNDEELELVSSDMALEEPLIPVKAVQVTRHKKKTQKRSVEHAEKQQDGSHVKKPRVTLSLSKAEVKPHSQDAGLLARMEDEDELEYTSPMRFVWSELDIPYVCPHWDCDHTVPANMPMTLIDMFRALALLVHNGGENAKGVAMAALKICMALAAFREADHARRAALALGYPTLDLPAIVPFVRGMKPELDVLIFTTTGKNSCFVWTNLLEELTDMGSDLQALEKGKANFSQLAMQARPGGYGPRGSAFIENTLMSLYGPTGFKTDAMAPLTFRTFTRYILIPHITIALIIHDKTNDCDEETGAWEHMVRQADHGAAIHPLKDDDPELEQIFENNTRFWRSNGGHPTRPKEPVPVLPARLRGEQKTTTESTSLMAQIPLSRPRPTPTHTRAANSISPQDIKSPVEKARVEQPAVALETVVEELTVTDFPAPKGRVLRSQSNPKATETGVKKKK
ncbi:hypothetical protein HWV62_22100 [Athelia sp. TMB]|nr:hypothetical protein HWV62_22100 [Athelia sp. TMB]